MQQTPGSSRREARRAERRPRSAKLGSDIEFWRSRRYKTKLACAALLGTSRDRYDQLETGESEITVVELEVLAEFLGVAIETFLPTTERASQRNRIEIELRPGDVLDIKAGTTDVSLTIEYSAEQALKTRTSQP